MKLAIILAFALVVWGAWSSMAAPPIRDSTSALTLPAAIMTPGDTLSVSCQSGLSGSWQAQSATLSCLALATPTPRPTATRTVTPTPTTTSAVMKLGVNEDGDHRDTLVSDLVLTHGSTYIYFNVPLNPPVAAETAAGIQPIRLLRYKSACPLCIDDANHTIVDLANFALANRGGWYETGNEPGGPGQDGLDPGFYVWQNAVYNAIKTMDPSAIVDGPGVFNWDDPSYAYLKYLEGVTLYAPSNTMLYDRVAVHIYPYDWCMTSDWLASAKASIDGAIATGRPVDITEIGDHWPQCAAWGVAVSVATRQSEVQTIVDYARAKGVKTMVWYLHRQAPSRLTGWLVGNSLTPPDNVMQPEGLGWIQ